MKFFNLLTLLFIFASPQFLMADTTDTGTTSGSIASSCTCATAANIDFGTLTAGNKSTNTAAVACSGNDDDVDLSISVTTLSRDESAGDEASTIPVEKTTSTGTACKGDGAVAEICADGVLSHTQDDHPTDGSYSDAFIISIGATSATSDLQGNYDGSYTATYNCATK